MSDKILAGRYVLVEQIGVGGMAIVYRAIDRNTGHSVAVKLLKPEFNRDAEFVSRFQREAEAASKMTHHNIVNLLDVGMDGGNRYLIMEYVRGKTLKEVIQEKGRLSAPVAVQITIRILSALQHAHQNGISSPRTSSSMRMGISRWRTSASPAWPIPPRSPAGMRSWARCIISAPSRPRARART